MGLNSRLTRLERAATNRPSRSAADSLAPLYAALMELTTDVLYEGETVAQRCPWLTPDQVTVIERSYNHGVRPATG